MKKYALIAVLLSLCLPPVAWSDITTTPPPSPASLSQGGATTGQSLVWSGIAWTPTTLASGSGTATSVGLSLPSIFNVTGSPVTTSGTLTATLGTEPANNVFAGPAGASGTPLFRQLVTADIQNCTVLPAQIAQDGATTGQALIWNGTAWTPTTSGGSSGTVTSVSLSLPSIFNVTGSPVTTSGTLTATLANANQNYVLAGPTSGSGTPTFRTLVAADIPATTISLSQISNSGAAANKVLTYTGSASVWSYPPTEGFNPLNYGALGNVATLTGVSVTGGSTSCTCSATFSAGATGSSYPILIPGAGPAYNSRGAYANSTAYAMGDYVTYEGLDWTPFVAFTSGSSFNPNQWNIITSTTRALETYVASVSGGVATLATAASSTVSSGTAYFGHDDTSAFNNTLTAAAVSGGDVYVPPGTYFVQNVNIPTGVRINLGPDVVFKMTPGVTHSSLFYAGYSTTQSVGSSITGPHWTIDWTGYDPIVTNGSLETRLLGAVTIYNVADYAVSGLTNLNCPCGNAVQISPYNNTTNPVRGTVTRINAIGAPYGYGAVQVDGCDGLVCDSLLSDMGRALDIETDDSDSGSGPNIGRIAQNIVARNIMLEPRNSTVSNSAVGLVSHSETIQNVDLQSIYANNGGCGVFTAYDVPGTGYGFLDDVSIKGLRVVGGGQGLCIQNNSTFDSFTVDNFQVNGATSNSAISNGAAMNYAAGVSLRDGVIQNSHVNSLVSAYSTGSPIVGVSQIENVQVLTSLDNGSSAVVNNSLQQLLLFNLTGVDTTGGSYSTYGVTGSTGTTTFMNYCHLNGCLAGRTNGAGTFTEVSSRG